MKTIKKPFAESACARMERVCTKYELAHRKYMDLKMIRDRIAKGQMSPQLYDFLNADKSLEHLLQGLPRPTEGVTCEALTMSQLKILDATIATEAVNLKELMKAVWMAFREWFLDFWERNRWEQRSLKVLAGKWKVNPGGFFGDDSTFNGTTVLMFPYNAWEALVDGARSLNEVVKKLVANPKDIKNWSESYITDVANGLKPFGRYCDENGIIRQGQPEYRRSESTCANLRWRFQEIGANLDKVINLLGEEIDLRRQFHAFEQMFLSASGTDRRPYLFARRVVFHTKECSLIPARTLKVMLHRVIKSVNSQYRIGNPNAIYK